MGLGLLLNSGLRTLVGPPLPSFRYMDISTAKPEKCATAPERSLLSSWRPRAISPIRAELSLRSHQAHSLSFRDISMGLATIRLETPSTVTTERRVRSDSPFCRYLYLLISPG